MGGVSAMFKLIAGGRVRGVSNGEGDRRDEGLQPCSR